MEKPERSRRRIARSEAAAPSRITSPRGDENQRRRVPTMASTSSLLKHRRLNPEEDRLSWPGTITPRSDTDSLHRSSGYSGSPRASSGPEARVEIGNWRALHQTVAE